jgi:3-oxoacyl-[acyl-carrier-protein] synthase II
MPKGEIWVTGIGAVSALGRGIVAHSTAVRQKRSGLAPLALFGSSPDPVIAGMVPRDVITEGIDATAADRADRLVDMAIEDALAQSGKEPFVNADLVLGTTQGNIHGGTLYYKLEKQGVSAPIDLIKGFLACSTADRMAVKYCPQGKTFTVSSACASGSTAIFTAAFRLMQHHSSCAIAAGVDVLSPFVVAGFNALRLVSKEPCRPFDARRDGLNPGEGAAALIMERKEHALERGASPLVKITGYGSALEAYHYTRSDPEGKGITAAIRSTLDMAGIGPDEVDYIHAHGTATVFNDISEYNGLKTVFGEHLKNIPVTSTKSMTGHTLGASGTIASVFSILSIKESLVPATLFHSEKDPAFVNLWVVTEPIYRPVRCVLVVSLGFGGEVASVLFEKVDNGRDRKSVV